MDSRRRTTLGELALTIFASVALLHEAAYRGCLASIWTPKSACPLLLIGLVVLGGAGLVIGNRTNLTAEAQSPRVTSIVGFVCLAVLGLARPQLFLAAVAGGLITHGALGLVTGRIPVRGRHGPTHVYEGFSAFGWGALFVLFGLGGLVLGVAHEMLPDVFTHPVFGSEASRGPSCR